jgi:hypothetical protein
VPRQRRRVVYFQSEMEPMRGGIATPFKQQKRQ